MQNNTVSKVFFHLSAATKVRAMKTSMRTVAIALFAYVCVCVCVSVCVCERERERERELVLVGGGENNTASRVFFHLSAATKVRAMKTSMRTVAIALLACE